MTFFSIYSETIMRALEGMPDIKEGEYNMNNIRYADDTVLIADNEYELQDMLDTVVRESEKKGLSLNKKKTEVMVISKKNCTHACNIVMNGTVLKQVHKFNYLGSLITSDGRCINEIKRRMAQAKAYFQNMKSILTNTRLSLGVRKRVLHCYIEPILLYGCESWSMTKQTSTSIEAMEMWFLRRMLRLSWTETITNLEILSTASSTRKLMSNIKRRQAECLGHVMRKGKLEHLLTTGNIEGKRSRGRQRIKQIQDGIAAWLGRSTADMFVDARDRKKWKRDRLRLQQTRQLMMMMMILNSTELVQGLKCYRTDFVCRCYRSTYHCNNCFIINSIIGSMIYSNHPLCFSSHMMVDYLEFQMDVILPNALVLMHHWLRIHVDVDVEVLTAYRMVCINICVTTHYCINNAHLLTILQEISQNHLQNSSQSIEKYIASFSWYFWCSIYLHL